MPYHPLNFTVQETEACSGSEAVNGTTTPYHSAASSKRKSIDEVAHRCRAELNVIC